MLVQAARQEPGDDIEIFIVMRGEAARVALGFRDRASRRGQPPADFEFGGYLHFTEESGNELFFASPGACFYEPETPQAKARATLRDHRDFHFAVAVFHVLEHLGKLGE